MLPFAITAITLALVFYTLGVFSEKITGTLKGWHLAMFWTGFVFDTTGTTLMSKLAKDVFTFNFHSVTGSTAILLMVAHAIWATAILFKGSEKSRRNFHHYSIIVWIIWLIPYLSGLLFGILQ